MKESLRRVILFTVIVITGSILILFDVPLIILIPLILSVGFLVLVLLGAITPSDIKSVFKRPKFENLKKIAVMRRLDEMKFFEKKPVLPDKKTSSPKKKEGPGLSNAKKSGAVSPLRSFLSSLGSLRTVLKERRKQRKKVEHINEMLDKTVSEKVKGPALAGAGTSVVSGTSLPGSSGGGGRPGEQAKEQDPFISLSGDEFDVSLLDGLDDAESALPALSSGQGLSPLEVNEPGPAINEPDIAIPSLDISLSADDILKDNAGGLEEFSGLEGGESIDQDFKDLDNLDLDDVDLDVDLEGEPPRDSGSVPSPESENSPPSPAGNQAVSPATPSTNTVKTDWIPSDAPRGAGSAENEISTQADMASFSKGASTGDEDLLSSLASDVKHVTKERNLSLIRDLRDFKASASEIENELRETHEWLKTSRIQKEKGPRPPKE